MTEQATQTKEATPDTQETTEKFTSGEDGNLQVSEDLVSPEPSPDDQTEEPSNEENSEEDQKAGQEEEDKQTGSELPEEGQYDKYRDKTLQDVAQMHLEAQKKIQPVMEENKKLKQQLSEFQEDLPPEEKRKQMNAEKLQQEFDKTSQEIREKRQELDELDEFDSPDEIKDLQQEVNELERENQQIERDWLKKYNQEMIEGHFNSRENQQFISDKKQEFQERGIELSDDQFQKVTNMAKTYLEDGKLTGRAYHKALVDQFGLEKVRKFDQVQTEQKMRKDVKNADAKVPTAKTHADTSGTNSRMINYKDLSPKQRDEFLSGLDDDELKRLRSQLKI